MGDGTTDKRNFLKMVHVNQVIHQFRHTDLTIREDDRLSRYFEGHTDKLRLIEFFIKIDNIVRDIRRSP